MSKSPSPRRTPLVVACFVALFIVSRIASAMPVILTQTSSQVGNLERTEWLVQVGPSPIETFRMTRLRKAGLPDAQLRGAMLFLPSLGTNFSLYEQPDPNRGRGSATAVFFARRNYDVYGYSPRFEGIPAGACEAGALDCSAMAGWDIQSMVDDVSFVRDHIETLTPGANVVAGGLSLGGILAVAVADADPARYDGFFPWEGMLTSNDAQVLAMNAGYCAGTEAQIAAGLTFDAVGIGVFKTSAQQALVAPDGPTTIPFFPPFLTNRQAFLAGLTAPPPGPVSMPVPGYLSTAPNGAGDGLEFASEEKVIENVLTTFSNYTPLPIIRDLSCSLAGLETAYTDNLGAFTGSILMIGGGQGFGAFMGDQLNAFTGTADKTLLLEPSFGHVDHFFTPQHRHFVEFPILHWLQQLW
ncbi:MAG: hypothetical protein AAGM22_05350 [Acidobacteriota bacterium]